MRKIFVLITLLLFSLPSLVFGEISLPFSDDFESYTVGYSLPSPWENGHGGPGIVTTAKAHSGTKSVTPVSIFASSMLDLGTDYTDFLQYEGWCYTDGGTGIIGFHEQFSNMLPNFNAVHFEQSGDVWFRSADRDTGFSVQIASGLPAGWHHARAHLNFEDLIGSVWLDGMLVLDSVPISPKGVVYEWDVGSGEGPLRHIGVSHYGGGPVYFDDFSVSEYSDEEEQPELVGLPEITPWSGDSWIQTLEYIILGYVIDDIVDVSFSNSNTIKQVTARISGEGVILTGHEFPMTKVLGSDGEYTTRIRIMDPAVAISHLVGFLAPGTAAPIPGTGEDLVIHLVDILVTDTSDKEYIFPLNMTLPNVFDSLREISTGRITYYGAMCPVDLCVTDPEGRMTGTYGGGGTLEYKDIPNSVYSGKDSDPEFVAILNAPDGTYDIEITGTEDGEYDFISTQSENEVLLSSEETLSVDISEGETHFYSSTIGTGSTGGGGGCFIATVAYGSQMEPHVKVLRKFRDRFMMNNYLGKAFIGLYSAYSPPAADFIANHATLQTLVRWSLLPFVGVSWVTLNIGPIPAMIFMFLLCFSLVGIAGFTLKKLKK